MQVSKIPVGRKHRQIVYTKATQTTYLAYDILKRELVGRGFEITKVTPIASAGLMFGYAIETTEPNYQLWEEFALEE